MMNYDAVFIGGGHNGLVCAAYLARAGLKVKVFEKRPVLGGACVTEQLADGYQASTLAHQVSLLSPKVMEDLNLEDHGLKLLKLESGHLSLVPEGRYMLISSNQKETHAEISKFSVKDADAHIAFERELEDAAAILRRFLEDRPPNFKSGLPEFWQFLKTGRKIHRLTVAQKEKIMNIMTMSLGDYLDSWFESDAVKGHYAGLASVGNFVHPYSAGSAFSLVYHKTGKMRGRSASSWNIKSGMGGLAEALENAAAGFGAEIQTDAEIVEIVAEGDDTDGRAGRVYGVKLKDGTFVKSRTVIANCTPYVLFNDLVDAPLLPTGFLRRMRNYRYSSGTMKINIALRGLPEFTALASAAKKTEVLNRTLIIAPSLGYIERAFHDGRIRGFPRKPFISLFFPTLSDPELAPKDGHVASLICQHFNRRLPDDMNWQDLKDEAAEEVLQVMEDYAPGFKDLIVGYQAITPYDLEEIYGLTGGDMYHGAMHPNQMFSFRPAARFADYRTPLKDLYICGAGAHPGGGVSGLPGMLCAQEVLKDISKA